jgi:ATP-dependent DNA ligase
VFAHACLGPEGIVSKKIDRTYRSGPRRVWIKVRNPAGIAAGEERDLESVSPRQREMFSYKIVRHAGPAER